MGDKWWIHVWITHWRIWKDFLTHWGASGVEQRNWNRKENKEMGEKNQRCDRKGRENDIKRKKNAYGKLNQN